MQNNKEKLLQQALKEIGQHAVRLYDLMDPGTTIDIIFSKAEEIVVPTQLPKIRHLIIIKPNIHLALSLTPINNTN
jgi:hypothetical protein